MIISEWKSLDKNTLRGVFTVELDSGLCISGAMLHKKGETSWCGFPGIPQYQNGAPFLKDGKQVYKPILTIPDRDRRDKFSAQVIKALEDAGHI